MNKTDDASETAIAAESSQPERSSTAKVGVINPLEQGILCGVCGSPINRDMAKPVADLFREWGAVSPCFCAECETWFHPGCLAESGVQGKGLCPKCKQKASARSSVIYCQACAKANVSVKVDKQWPSLACFRCGQPVSLAAVYSVGGSEIGWLVGLGVLALGAFIASLAMGTAQPVKVVMGSLAAVFALPWILIMLSGLVKSMMPMGMKLGGDGPMAGGLEDILIAEARQFRQRPRWYRFGKAYLYGALNALTALLVLVVGCAIIYYLSSMNQR